METMRKVCEHHGFSNNLKADPGGLERPTYLVEGIGKSAIQTLDGVEQSRRNSSLVSWRTQYHLFLYINTETNRNLLGSLKRGREHQTSHVDHSIEP